MSISKWLARHEFINTADTQDATIDTLADWTVVGVYGCCTGLLIDDLDLINDHDLIHDGVNILVWSTRDGEYDYAVSIASTATGPTSPPQPEWHYPSLAECVTLLVLVGVLVLKRRVERWIKEKMILRSKSEAALDAEEKKQ